MKVLYGINDKFEEELKKLCNKDELTTTEIDAVYKMVDVIKDIATIEAMRNAEMEGYSGANARGRSGEYANAGGAYGSYARNRDSMGRYTSRDGGSNYSRHDKEEMIDNLRMKARNARTEEERMSYLDMADRLSM
ncbi:MAG: hypothetical protein J6U54_21390 [Clostridiales bacterium]|nr:hypothetical protein [Clostridiales bacterium]